MKKFTRYVASAALLIAGMPASAKEMVIVVNEGTWQSDNGRLSYFEEGSIVSNSWFRDVNGRKLGDTPNDIIQVKPNLIAIALNWSNIIQFIDNEGHAVAAIENVPNCRKMATDGDYLYVTSYAHECETLSGVRNFTRGYVAKIDLASYKVVDAIEVGYEPEGIAYYDGALFVANSGGYAFQENHDYEQTVSVIDVASFSMKRVVDTGKINLYGKLSQAGKYLCINSAGDYYDVSAATVIMDCAAALSGASDADCVTPLSCASTYNTTDSDGNFLVVGSRFSYEAGGYEFDYVTIEPEKVISTKGSDGVHPNTMPGTMAEDFKQMTSPYGIYMNPYTGFFYGTDAQGYAEGGTLYQWSPAGNLTVKQGVYQNPGHFLALDPNPDSSVSEVDSDNVSEDADVMIYNLQGIRVNQPQPGEIYIINRKKVIY